MTSIVLVEYTGNIKNIKTKEFSFETLYKKCGFRSAEHFDKMTTWSIEYNKEICNLTFNKGDNTTVYSYYYNYCNDNTCPSTKDVSTGISCSAASTIHLSAIVCFGYNNSAEKCYDSDGCPHQTGPMGDDKNPIWSSDKSFLENVINIFKRLFGIQ